MQCATHPLFYELVGASKQRCGNRQARRLGRLGVDSHGVAFWLFDGNVRRFLAFDDLVDQMSALPCQRNQIRTGSVRE